MMDFGKHLRIGAGFQGNQSRNYRIAWLEFSVEPPEFWGEERAGGWIHLWWPMTESILPTEASINIPKSWVPRAPRLVNQYTSMFHCAGYQTPRRQRSSFVPDLTLWISSSGCWFLFFNIFCNKWVIQWVNRIPELCETSSKVTEPKEGVMETSDLRADGWKHSETWTCDWPLKWGAVLWDWALALWNLPLPPGRCCQNGVWL